MSGLLNTWAQRSYLHQVTDEQGLTEHLAAGSRGIYCGFDPTADSLQIGNLVPIMMLAHAQRAGHRPVVVAGGATGLIGDPSGKSQERPMLARERIQGNVDAQASIFRAVLRFDPTLPNPARWLNNIDWLGAVPTTEFLRDYGKHFSVNQMLQRDNVRLRLEREGQGISFTEFSYGILQAIDFGHLFVHENVTVQIGGSDQWGNIIGGIDLTRRVHSASVYGVTAKLITRADGQKFGKTESGSVWLSAGRTLPFAYYQFWLNATDADVGTYLKLFTFVELDEIDEILAEHRGEPGLRKAQHRLAREATRLLHGPEESADAERISTALFGGDVEALSLSELDAVFGAMSSSTYALDSLKQGVPVVDVLTMSGICGSKREARDMLSAGAIRLNGRLAREADFLMPTSLLGSRYALISRGKRVRHLTRWC